MLLLVSGLLVLFAAAAGAHGGGIDSQGGHNETATGTYHFHQGPLDGQTFESREAGAAALAELEGETQEPPELPSPQLDPVPPGQIRIASFNIRIYSTGSRTDAELELIADRLQQFDLVAVQELRDQEVVNRTLAILAGRGHEYEALVSEPVGRGVLERYAFFWRPDRVDPVGAGAIVADPGDLFIREPFYASFRAGGFDFTLITIHSIFGDTVGDRRAEGLLLDDIYRAVQGADPEEQDVILAGDFNLPPEDAGMAEVDAVLDPVFTGAIRTTISDASLYDNFWWDPDHVAEWTGAAGIDRFDESVFGNNDEAASLAVSDHRPVWVTFRTDLPDDDGGERPSAVDPGSWGEVKGAR